MDDNTLTRVIDRARQWRYPGPFRIAAVPIPVAPPEPTPAPEPVPPPVAAPEWTGEAPDGLGDRTIADLATDLWRARRRLAAVDEDEAGRDQRRAARHVEAMWDRLSEAGVTIQDHDGTPFDVGLDLTVLAYEDDPAVTAEVVKETVEPTVYRNGRQIKTGKVIVAMPEKGN